LAGRVNREAIVEIARQLRLRNLTGMIVVALIHVKDETEREVMVDLMRASLVGDRGKSTVYGFSALSLLEMIRTAP
jgi:ribonuclease G